MMVQWGLFVSSASRVSNRGAVILLAMVFLLMLAMIAAMIMRSSVLQLHMAGNDQFLEEALHAAQGIAEALSLQPGNFILAGSVGDTNCPIGTELPGCHRSQLQMPDAALALEGLSVEVRVIRQDPLLLNGFPLRDSEDVVSSSASFDAALFEIDVALKGHEAGLGGAHVVQGIAIRIPAFR